MAFLFLSIFCSILMSLWLIMDRFQCLEYTIKSAHYWTFGWNFGPLYLCISYCYQSDLVLARSCCSQFQPLCSGWCSVCYSCCSSSLTNQSAIPFLAPSGRESWWCHLSSSFHFCIWVLRFRLLSQALHYYWSIPASWPSQSVFAFWFPKFYCFRCFEPKLFRFGSVSCLSCLLWSSLFKACFVLRFCSFLIFVSLNFSCPLFLQMCL